MPTLNWSDGTINYLDEGKGTALLLLHGYCESLRMWDDWKQPLLQRDLRIISMDLPGFGRSTARATSIAQYADAVAALVDELNMEKLIVIGHSMGGYIGLELLSRGPAWMQGLGLFHSHPYADDEDKKKEREKVADFIESNGHMHYIKQLVPKFFAPGRDGSYSHDRDRLIVLASRAPAQGIIDASLAMRDRCDHSDALAQTDLPILFINGAHDQTMSEDKRRNMISLPARAQLCYLPHAGHLGTVEAPRQTQLAVRDFVRFCEEMADHG